MNFDLAMQSYLERVEKSTNLDELFTVWKEAHLEKEYFCSTFPMKNKKNVFPKDFEKNWTDDGYLSDNTEDIGILFVLKEPNEQGAIEDNCFANKEFWIKNNINDFRKAIPRRMYKTAKKILCDDITEEKWTQRAAVMNLNKRGGYRRCNYPGQLINYTKVYKDFIEKQIEIISPKVIVFLCGVNISKEIIDILNVSQYKVYYGPHPASWGKDEKFLDKIKKI